MSGTNEFTRRDFLNAALVGAGAALLEPVTNTAAATDKRINVDRLSPSGSHWTGFGGTGDYAWSNGNTELVRDAAHKIRDGVLNGVTTELLNEEYDLVIIGGGFSGFAAAYEFIKKFPAGKRCLVIDNHPVFGGEAKQNEFLIDGEKLSGPQGSSEFFVLPAGTGGRYERLVQYWGELGIPDEFEFQDMDSGVADIKIPFSNYAPMYWQESQSSVGYFFHSGKDNAGEWVIDPWKNNLVGTPLSSRLKQELSDWYFRKRVPAFRADYAQWLDSMTYQELLEKHMGFSPEVTRYTDPLLAAGAFGACADVISAYAAYRIGLPCADEADGSQSNFETAQLLSFPGGNTGVLRYLLKAVNPDAIAGQYSFNDILAGPISFQELDKTGKPVRIRLSATVFQVEHKGAAKSADSVIVRYLQNGKFHEIRSKAVVMATGSWVTRNVVRGLAEERLQALNEFHYSPMLVVNVALRNWQFLARLGIAAARWFNGFGWHGSIRRTPVVGAMPGRLSPAGPVVMTFYVPFLNPGHDVRTQGMLGRQELLHKSYRDFEMEIRSQLTLLFGHVGFNADRDIAGIILNRWGHAYVSPQPGFFFGRDGRPAPREVVRKPFYRIAFGHSEQEGNMSMAHAVKEGARAAGQALEWI